MTANSKKTKRTLSELCRDLVDIPAHSSGVAISGITCSSRAVKPGYLFVALKGTVTDGSQYIGEAVKAGARAILCEVQPVQREMPNSVAVVVHKQARQILARLAARFYHGQPEYAVAVTGTNGKTSVAHFCRHIWALLGRKSASVGTLGLVSQVALPSAVTGSSLTTPDPVGLHQMLQSLQQHDVTHVAVEASSHGLHQYRLDGIRFTAAAFTNLSRDHLDYHGNEENYFNAKMRLFRDLLPAGADAVVNADSEHAARVLEICKSKGHHVIDFGRQATALRIDRITTKGFQQHAEITVAGKRYQFTVPFLGEFQLYNILCALGLVMATGVDAADAIQVVPQLPAVEGRMQQVDVGEGVGVFVDYAHTPDALKQSLELLKEATGRTLWVVFGCGGDRDKGKRPQMGAIAGGIADQVIVTDDNPRTENPASIRQEILQACDGAEEIGDREEAIRYAVSHLQEGDVLLVAGKGHEKTQTVGTQVLPFDDVEVVKRVARGKNG